MTKTHYVGMLVDDASGVMARISGLFARRGFNISTITVGKTRLPGISKMVFSIKGDEGVLEQIVKQVNKLVSVIKITEIRHDDSIVVELGLIKVSISNDKMKDDIIKYADVYKAKIVDITPKAAILQILGDPQKIDAFIELVKRFGIKEISRTGVTGMSRGHKVMGDKTK